MTHRHLSEYNSAMTLRVFRPAQEFYLRTIFSLKLLAQQHYLLSLRMWSDLIWYRLIWSCLIWIIPPQYVLIKTPPWRTTDASSHLLICSDILRLKTMFVQRNPISSVMASKNRTVEMMILPFNRIFLFILFRPRQKSNSGWRQPRAEGPVSIWRFVIQTWAKRGWVFILCVKHDLTEPPTSWFRINHPVWNDPKGSRVTGTYLTLPPWSPATEHVDLSLTALSVTLQLSESLLFFHRNRPRNRSYNLGKSDCQDRGKVHGRNKGTRSIGYISSDTMLSNAEFKLPPKSWEKIVPEIVLLLLII